MNDSISGSPLNALYSYLQQADQWMQQLSAMLEEEKAALSREQPEAIDAITARKDALVDQIASLDGHRKQIFSQLGIQDSKDSLEQFINQQDEANQAKLRAAWESLRTHIVESAQKNTVNGMLLNASYHTTARLMAILQGKDPDAASDTYSSSGKMKSGGGYGGGHTRA